MKTEAQKKVIQAMQIVAENHHWWTLGLLRTLPFVWDDPRCNTMATNGKQILIDSDFVNRHPVTEVAGVLVHETIHVVHRHPLRRGNRDPQIGRRKSDLPGGNAERRPGHSILRTRRLPGRVRIRRTDFARWRVGGVRAEQHEHHAGSAGGSSVDGEHRWITTPPAHQYAFGAVCRAR